MKVRPTIEAFDAFLARRGARFEGIVVGGAALNLLGVIDRPTKDCDVLEPRLPSEIEEAARDFAVLQRQGGEALDDHWFNDGPGSLADLLPGGWRSKLEVIFEGSAIRLLTLCRGNPDWPAHVRQNLELVARKLSHGP